MIVKLTQEQMKQIELLFTYTEESLIKSCIQGYMGEAWADDAEQPAAVKIVVGDFCFVAGDSSSPAAEELVRHIPPSRSRDVLLVVPEHEGWVSVIEQVWEDKLTVVPRYAIKKEPHIFDRARLEQYAAAIDERFEIREIGEQEYYKVLEHEGFQDFCANFESCEDFLKRGLGYVAVCDGKIVSGASSYTVYKEGIEIEIATDPHFRRKGLALACGASLILACMDRDLYPSWDAANPSSVRLAEKLGYHMDFEYKTYIIQR